MTSHHKYPVHVTVRHSDYLVTCDCLTVRYTSPVDARYALRDLGVPFEQAASMVLIATLDAQACRCDLPRFVSPSCLHHGATEYHGVLA